MLADAESVASNTDTVGGINAMCDNSISVRLSPKLNKRNPTTRLSDTKQSNLAFRPVPGKLPTSIKVAFRAKQNNLGPFQVGSGNINPHYCSIHDQSVNITQTSNQSNTPKDMDKDKDKEKKPPFRTKTTKIPEEKFTLKHPSRQIQS